MRRNSGFGFGFGQGIPQLSVASYFAQVNRLSREVFRVALANHPVNEDEQRPRVNVL
jgi:hypothetical protein